MKQLLTKLFENQQLDRQEACAVLQGIGQNKYNAAQIAALISVYIMRGINIEEFLGFRDALYQLGTDLTALNVYKPVDIVGTGGDGKNTFNISTLSCFVVAAAGYKVAKHGNYGASSVSGSSTVMEQHGVKFTDNIGELERSLDKANLCFLHAPMFNDALKVVAPIRRELGVRTFFNMLGPLVNPIRNQHMLLGVFNLKMLRMYQYIYQNTNIDFSIVHSIDGYDEISLTDSFKVVTKLGEQLYTPNQLGFEQLDQTSIYGGETVEQAAAIFSDVIYNRATSAQKNVVIANAGFAIQLIDKQKTIEECIGLARETIESGKLKETYRLFLELNS